jgi:hypothetical protein
MKACVISLNLSKGLQIESHLRKKTIPFKYYYDHEDLSLKQYSEDSEGVRSYIDSIYDDNDIFIEFPVSFEYEYMYDKNPDTKFIYIDITKDEWISAMHGLKVFPFLDAPYPFEEYFCKKYLDTTKNGVKDLTDDELSQIYYSHIWAVETFFNNNENFKKISIDDPLLFEIFDEFLSI